MAQNSIKNTENIVNIKKEEKLIKLKEKALNFSAMQENSFADPDRLNNKEDMIDQNLKNIPNEDPQYRDIIREFKFVWDRYLNEDELMVLNDWDSLYRIIAVL